MPAERDFGLYRRKARADRRSRPTLLKGVGPVGFFRSVATALDRGVDIVLAHRAKGCRLANPG